MEPGCGQGLVQPRDLQAPIPGPGTLEVESQPGGWERPACCPERHVHPQLTQRLDLSSTVKGLRSY